MTGNMELLGGNPTQAYVLRHAFQPKEFLREQLSQLAAPGSKSKWASHFGIFGSDELVVESGWSSDEFDRQRHVADATLAKEANVHLHIESITGRIGRNALELFMQPRPQDMAAYARIRDSLGLISMGWRGYTPGFDTPTMYVTPIPLEALGPLDEAQERLTKLNRAVKDPEGRHLYQVTPSPNLVGGTVLRATRDSFGVVSPEAPLS